MTTWVMVADASRARFFRAENRNGPLQEMADRLHVESRLKGRDLETDGPGRSFDRAGQGRHAMGKEVDVKTHEAQRFARELCDYLDKSAAANEYDKLYIVAAPAFLGLVRDCLANPVRKRVAGEVSKDMVNQDVQAIRATLPDFL